MKKPAIFLIYIYRTAASPFLHYIFGHSSSCAFYPTCSEYGLSAVRKYGFFKGASLALKRVIRCHPFREHGYDPLQ